MSQRWRQLRRLGGWAFLALLLLGLSLVPMFVHPIGYLKAVSVVGGYQLAPDLASAPALQVEELVRRIPYQPKGKQIFIVHPALQYQRTIGEGRGNCANMVRGLTYDLNRQGIDYQIIHILPRSRVLQGWGHTILRLPYRLDNGEERVGLVDIYDSGPVTVDDKPADLSDMVQARPEQVKVLKLPSKREERRKNRYVPLLKVSAVGYTPADQVRRMEAITTRIYRPLGNEKVERMVYLAIAVVFGYNPEIRLPVYEDAFDPELLPEARFYQLCLWVSRLSLAALALLALAAAGCLLPAERFRPVWRKPQPK